MKARKLLLIIIIGSTFFNVTFFVLTQQNQSDNWFFIDLGLADIQDSYLQGAPGLESPFGIIGDVPGGYVLYSGSPIQQPLMANLTGWFEINPELTMENPEIIPASVILAGVFFFVPIIGVFIVGRRSYGSAKT